MSKSKRRIVFTEDNNRGRGQGRIVNKKGSRKLYVDFTYFGERIEKTTGLDDTPENRMAVNKWLNSTMDKIDRGIFRFAEAFPNASDEEKEHFAKVEGWNYAPGAADILFKDYLVTWRANVLDRIKSHTKKEDYRCALESRIESYFSEMSFFQITSDTLKEFIASLVHTRGSKVGQPLSEKRIKNVKTVLKAIWDKAREVHRWTDLPDPFEALEKESSRPDDDEEAIHVNDLTDDYFDEESEDEFLQNDIPTERLPLRFWEWQLIYEHLDECNRLNAKFMALTGAIASEMAGVERRHIRDGFIYIRQAIVKKKLRRKVKTQYRMRKIRITKAIKIVLDQVLARSKGRFIFTRPSGLHLCPVQFGKKWNRAVEKAGISKHVPYCLRHSFAAWCLAADINPNRLVHLMGHSTKKMVYERYGRYVEGLDEDHAAIREFFGDDFLGEKPKLELVSMKSDGGRSYLSRNGNRYAEELPLEQAVS